MKTLTDELKRRIKQAISNHMKMGHTKEVAVNKTVKLFQEANPEYVEYAADKIYSQETNSRVQRNKDVGISRARDNLKDPEMMEASDRGSDPFESDRLEAWDKEGNKINDPKEKRRKFEEKLGIDTTDMKTVEEVEFYLNKFAQKKASKKAKKITDNVLSSDSATYVRNGKEITDPEEKEKIKNEVLEKTEGKLEGGVVSDAEEDRDKVLEEVEEAKETAHQAIDQSTSPDEIKRLLKMHQRGEEIPEKYKSEGKLKSPAEQPELLKEMLREQGEDDYVDSLEGSGPGVDADGDAGSNSDEFINLTGNVVALSGGDTEEMVEGAVVRLETTKMDYISEPTGPNGAFWIQIPKSEVEGLSEGILLIDKDESSYVTDPGFTYARTDTRGIPVKLTGDTDVQLEMIKKKKRGHGPSSEQNKGNKNQDTVRQTQSPSGSEGTDTESTHRSSGSERVDDDIVNITGNVFSSVEGELDEPFEGAVVVAEVDGEKYESEPTGPNGAFWIEVPKADGGVTEGTIKVKKNSYSSSGKGHWRRYPKERRIMLHEAHASDYQLKLVWVGEGGNSDSDQFINLTGSVVALSGGEPVEYVEGAVVRLDAGKKNYFSEPTGPNGTFWIEIPKSEAVGFGEGILLIDKDKSSYAAESGFTYEIKNKRGIQVRLTGNTDIELEMIKKKKDRDDDDEKPDWENTTDDEIPDDNEPEEGIDYPDPDDEQSTDKEIPDDNEPGDEDHDYPDPPPPDPGPPEDDDEDEEGEAGCVKCGKPLKEYNDDWKPLPTGGYICDECRTDQEKEGLVGSEMLPGSATTLATSVFIPVLAAIILPFLGFSPYATGFIIVALILLTTRKFLPMKEPYRNVRPIFRAMGFIFLMIGVQLFVGNRPIFNLIPLLIGSFGIISFTGTLSSGKKDAEFRRVSETIRMFFSLSVGVMFLWTFRSVFSEPMLGAITVCLVLAFFLVVPDFLIEEFEEEESKEEEKDEKSDKKEQTKQMAQRAAMAYATGGASEAGMAANVAASQASQGDDKGDGD